MSFFERIKKRAESLGRAALSPPLDEFNTNVRLAVCQSCEWAEIKNNNIYCKKCGCPQWRLAELHVKARMSGAVCPKGKWPEVKPEDLDTGIV